MVTGNRPGFLRQAIRYYQRFEWPRKELILVANDPAADISFVPDTREIGIVQVDQPLVIGQAINLGIEAAEGSFVVRMDDDDWYHPLWVTAAMERLHAARNPERALTAAGKPLVLIVETGELLRYEKPAEASPLDYARSLIGSSYAFHKTLWEECPFPPVERGEDVAFFGSHAFDYVPIEVEGMFVYVRLPSGGLSGVPQEYYERHFPLHEQPLEAFVPAEDAAFYRSLEMIANLAS
jgi:hypothetical protein